MAEEIDLARLKALAEKATPGPYKITLRNWGDGGKVWSHLIYPIGVLQHADTPGEHVADYIAALDPATVLALIARAEELDHMKASEFVHAHGCRYWRMGTRHGQCSCQHTHLFEANPGMYDTSERFCVTCGIAESAIVERGQEPPKETT